MVHWMRIRPSPRVTSPVSPGVDESKEFPKHPPRQTSSGTNREKGEPERMAEVYSCVTLRPAMSLDEAALQMQTEMREVARRRGAILGALRKWLTRLIVVGGLVAGVVFGGRRAM